MPAELRVLWRLTAGDNGVDGTGCLPGNKALMPLDAVPVFYREQLEHQADQDTLNARRAEGDRVTVWKAFCIPVISFGPADRTSGLYLDTESGFLGHPRPYLERPPPLHQAFCLRPQPLDLRRNRLQAQGRGQLLAPHTLPGCIRLQHGHDPLVVRRQDRRCHALGPAGHQRSRHRTHHRFRDRDRPASTSATVTRASARR